jgi:hypothetical protein
MSKKKPHLQVYTSEHQHIGHFDGEFFYTMPQVPLRVDGDEVYTTELPCELVGNLIGNELRMLDGLTPYYFEE